MDKDEAVETYLFIESSSVAFPITNSVGRTQCALVHIKAVVYKLT